MPLSEHEQRVLRQIERQFEAERGLARSFEAPSAPADEARSAKRSAAGFVLGLLALLISFASSWVVGVIGFVVMVVCAVRFVQAFRCVLAAHIAELSSARPGQARGPARGGGALLSQLRDALRGPAGRYGSQGPGPGTGYGGTGAGTGHSEAGGPREGDPEADEGDEDEAGGSGPQWGD